MFINLKKFEIIAIFILIFPQYLYCDSIISPLPSNQSNKIKKDNVECLIYYNIDKNQIHYDQKPSNVYQEYYYFNNFGYIKCNAEIKNIDLRDKTISKLIICNINFKNYEIKYSPISKRMKKYYFNKPDDTQISILWEKKYSSYYNPLGKIENNTFHQFSTVFILDREESFLYQSLFNTFKHIKTDDYLMEKLFKTRWLDFIRSFQDFYPVISSIKFNRNFCSWYIKSEKGNSIFLQNNWILKKIENHWNLKHLGFKLYSDETSECGTSPEKFSPIYFFFPEKCSVSTTNVYKEHKHSINYLKTNVFNSNNYIFEILPNNNVKEIIYMASRFDPSKLFRTNCFVVVEKHSLRNNNYFSVFQRSAKFKEIIERHENFILNGNKIYNHKRFLPENKNNNKKTQIVDAMNTFRTHLIKDNTNNQLHFFLSQCPSGGFSDSDIHRLSNQFKKLHIKFIVVWEFHDVRQEVETVYQYLFKKVAERLKIKYTHFIIYSKDQLKHIRIPFFE